MNSGSRVPGARWLRLTSLAVAGLLAFSVAVIFNPSRLNARTPEVVEPILRGATAPAAAEGVAAPPLKSQPLERLSERVVYNPFGALNLGTGAHAPLGAPAAQPASAPASKKNSKPAPEVAAPPPPPPTAPPLPFTAVGSIAGGEVTGGQQVAFIKQQEQLLVVRAGDAIGPNYRVESITPQTIAFTYLPLMQRQTLALAP